MSEMANWIGIGVSIVSLVVAIVALILGSCASRKANVLQRRIVEIEENREADRTAERNQALFRAELRPFGESSTRLYVINQGFAEARNVKVTLDGETQGEIPPTIGPKSEVSCLMAFHRGWVPPFDLAVTWNDDSKEGCSYRTTLTF